MCVIVCLPNYNFISVSLCVCVYIYNVCVFVFVFVCARTRVRACIVGGIFVYTSRVYMCRLLYFYDTYALFSASLI